MSLSEARRLKSLKDENARLKKVLANSMLDQRASDNHIELKLIQAGKSTQNGFIESFNGRFRDERWFRDLSHARDIISD